MPTIHLGLHHVAEFPVCGRHQFHWVWWFGVLGVVLGTGVALFVGGVIALGLWADPLAMLCAIPPGLFLFVAWLLVWGRLLGTQVVKASRVTSDGDDRVILENVSPAFAAAWVPVPLDGHQESL